MKPWVFYWCALLILGESRAAPLIIGGREARHWYHFNDARSADAPHLAISSRGDSGGPLIQNGQVIGVISGVDRTDQDETTVYSTKTYFAGLHTRDFEEIASQAIADGSTLKR